MLDEITLDKTDFHCTNGNRGRVIKILDKEKAYVRFFIPGRVKVSNSGAEVRIDCIPKHI